MDPDVPIYGTANPAVLARIPSGARRVLDVGCGDGTLGRALRAAGTGTVVGITHSAAEAARAREALDSVVEADLDRWRSDDAPPGFGGFDVIVCSHVLEHLARPVRLLRELRRVAGPEALLVVALPNVLHWRQRLEFLRGRFRYTRGGLMDSTHLRFFDAVTAAGLVRDGGWEPREFLADGTFPGSRFLGTAGRRADRWATAAAPGLFGFQFVITARPGTESAPSTEPGPA